MEAVCVLPPQQPFPHFSPHLDPQHEHAVLSLLQSEQQGCWLPQGLPWGAKPNNSCGMAGTWACRQQACLAEGVCAPESRRTRAKLKEALPQNSEVSTNAAMNLLFILTPSVVASVRG
jgi:hypothetical protein